MEKVPTLVRIQPRAPTIYIMINTKPTQEQLEELWRISADYINSREIYSTESVYQTDRVQVSACDFVADVCDLVGYVDLDDEE